MYFNLKGLVCFMLIYSCNAFQFEYSLQIISSCKADVMCVMLLNEMCVADM